MISFLLGLIPGIGKIADAFGAYYSKKLDVDIEKYKVNGKIDEVRLQEAVKAMSGATVGDRAMRWLFAYPLGIWWTVALLNSGGRDYFGWHWSVHSFPLLETWGWIIVGFLFVASLGRR
jgi:hypothetical protein